jgi:hypothetical protein
VLSANVSAKDRGLAVLRNNSRETKPTRPLLANRKILGPSML